MSTQLIHNKIIAPSVDAVELTHKQIFPAEGVKKTTMSFEREEDMIVMCLSAFVHDYVHDYNLGSMHARVIKGNIHATEPGKPSLFQSLGITIGNAIYKIIAYPSGGPPRDINMYNDEQFEDEPTADDTKTSFYEHLNKNEEAIILTGGDKAFSGETQALKLNNSVLNEPVEKTLQFNDTAKFKIKESVIAEGIADNEDGFIKSVTFSDIKASLLVPPIIATLDLNKIVNVFEKNADFLDFHSSLNTYIINYLGCNDEDEEEEEDGEGEEDGDGDEDMIANESIKSSFNYIINDFKRGSESMHFTFFGDMFSLLLDSYNVINKNNDINPFDVLNSSEILYQFIIFYISYISAENYDTFKTFIAQTGGETPEGDGDEDGITMLDLDLDEPSGPLLKKTFQVEQVPEYVFITHNNLLTTITRGMFIKLGIWKKIFFPDTDIRSITPENYVFGIEELNQITYDKLVEIYPIAEHKNNELLILEILILKRLLVEMSPSKTLTFGAKIDDDLKNYMDAFYFDYFIKNTRISYKPEILLDPDTINNPTIYDGLPVSEEQDLEEMFNMCEEDCDEFGQEFSANSDATMNGGMKEGKEKEIEMVSFNKDPVIKRPNVTEGDVIEGHVTEGDVIEGHVIEEPVIEAPAIEALVIEEPAIEALVTEGPAIEALVTEGPLIVKNPEIDIIEPPRPPSMPILLNKLLKMYQNNIYTIKQLKNSRITPIVINEGSDAVTISNLYDLLALNETLMHKKGSRLNIPAPKYKFVINNAANVGSNINGSKMFISNSFLNDIETIIEDIRQNAFDEGMPNQEKLTSYTNSTQLALEESYTKLKTDFEEEVKALNSKKREKKLTIKEYNNLLFKKYQQKAFERTQIVPLENKALLLESLQENPEFYNEFVENKNYRKWFKDCQPIFGLYRTLQRGIFCPTSSMMDAMDNCSLKYNTTEPKEVGTSYSEIKYAGEGKNISFGGIVLNYNQRVGDKEELVAKICYTLVCNNPMNGQQDDVVTISTMPIKVSESNDLKARVAYRGVINKIQELYYRPYDQVVESDEIIEIEVKPISKKHKIKNAKLNAIKQMWFKMQYQFSPKNFNELLSTTALKTMGDYLQECQACFKWGGYVSSIEEDATDKIITNVTSMPDWEIIKDKLIYRSVNKGGTIMPYDINGNALRLGIQGDRPSGFRSIYMLLNGDDKGVNEQAMTGYMFTSSTQNPSRSLLVSRNSNEMRAENYSGLKGNIIYVTRELPVPDKSSLLESLEFLNIKDKHRKIQGELVIPEITESIIEGSTNIDIDALTKNPNTKLQPLKNSAYEDWYNYETEFMPEQQTLEVEEDKTDAEQARDIKINKLKQAEKMKGVSGVKKINIKQQIKDAKITLNRLLNSEQKPQRTIHNIPVESLDRLDPEELSKNGVSPEVFEIIKNEALEIKKAQEEAIEAEKARAELSAKKKETTSAEKKKIDANKKTILSQIATLNAELRGQINEVKMQIESENEKYNALTGRTSDYKKLGLESKETELAKIKKKKPNVKYTESIKQAEIIRLQEEINNLKETNKPLLDEINQIAERISELKTEKNRIEAPIEELEEELKLLSKQRKGGGTSSNKKVKKYRITKRQIYNQGKKRAKLTKRYKKIKIPKKTRKNI